MAERPDAPLSGVFRVVYFLAVAVVAVFVVVTGVFAFYDPPANEPFPGGGFFTPGDGSGGDGFGFDGQDGQPQSDGDERGDYNRNVSLILMAVSAGVFAAAILAFGPRFHPLRAGLLLGGLVVYLVGVGFWSGATDDWIGFVMSVVTFAVLTGSFAFLEEGLPLRYVERRPVRRLEIPPAPEPPAAPEPPPPAVPPTPTDEEPRSWE
ncbi:MAG: hypothetical protein Q7T33_14560 [Dehalococcoidia bacterium]|nr:hypothetical protein [Dehalococcoidia bacterium]